MRALGIILAGGSTSRMKELTNKRAVAAMPVAGSYRAIDFALSNMSNSRISRVAVLSQYNARSLNEHLSSSKWWDFGRKMGGLHVFTPVITKDNAFWYRGTADAMAQNLDFIRKSHEPYVVIAGGDAVYKLDYGKVLEYHMEKGADITVVCRKIPEREDARRFGVVSMDEDCRITEFSEKPVSASGGEMISVGIYVIRRRHLIELLEECIEEGRFDFVSDVLVRYRNEKKIYGYEMDGYWSNISTVESFYNTNMDFLDPETRRGFFNSYPPIYSKVLDLPPAKYNPGSAVKNSLVASGSIVNGVVENSVIFKNVFIGNNCVIRNSVVLNDVYISDNSYIDNCIIESRGTIRANSRYIGESGIRIVVEKNDRYLL